MVECGKTGPGHATGNLPLQKVPKKQIKWVFLLRVRNEDDDKPHPVKRKSGNLQKERRISFHFSSNLKAYKVYFLPKQTNTGWFASACQASRYVCGPQLWTTLNSDRWRERKYGGRKEKRRYEWNHKNPKSDSFETSCCEDIAYEK